MCNFLFDQRSILVQFATQNLIKIISKPLYQLLLGLDSSRLSFLLLLNPELLFLLSLRFRELRLFFFFFLGKDLVDGCLFSLFFTLHSIRILGFNEISLELVSDDLSKLIQVEFIFGLLERVVKPCRLFGRDFSGFLESFVLQDRLLVVHICATGITLHRDAELVLTGLYGHSFDSFPFLLMFFIDEIELVVTILGSFCDAFLFETQILFLILPRPRILKITIVGPFW